MLAIKIKDIKSFMAKLLNTDAFDAFLLEKAHIQTATTFTIDGHTNKAFFSTKELEDPELFPGELSCWSTMRNTCFQLIKGKKVPLLFKVTLIYNPQDSYSLLEQADAAIYSSLLKSFVVTIKFEQNNLILTTGTSLQTFIMDKTLDVIWDEAFRRFLTDKEIDFEEE